MLALLPLDGGGAAEQAVGLEVPLVWAADRLPHLSQRSLLPHLSGWMSRTEQMMPVRMHACQAWP